MDGAGPFRLFWSIVLPMSKPILGVVSVFAVITAWKDFLWPLLVLPDPDLQPLSVRLPAIAPYDPDGRVPGGPGHLDDHPGRASSSSSSGCSCAAAASGAPSRADRDRRRPGPTGIPWRSGTARGRRGGDRRRPGPSVPPPGGAAHRTAGARRWLGVPRREGRPGGVGHRGPAPRDPRGARREHPHRPPVASPDGTAGGRSATGTGCTSGSRCHRGRPAAHRGPRRAPVARPGSDLYAVGWLPADLPIVQALERLMVRSTPNP